MKKLGIGYENYKEFIDGNMYYVDKTLLIRDILDKGGKVTLFTRNGCRRGSACKNGSVSCNKAFTKIC